MAISIAILVCVFVIFTNTIVLLAIKRSRKLQTLKNVPLIGLAIADVLVGVMWIPFSVALELHPDNVIVCHVSLSCEVFMMHASLFNLVSVSMERWTAIFKPLRYHNIANQRAVGLVVASAWLASAFMLMLFEIQYEKGGASGVVVGQCGIVEKSRAWYLVLVFLIFYVVCALTLYMQKKVFAVIRHHMTRIRPIRITNTVATGIMACADSKRPESSCMETGNRRKLQFDKVNIQRPSVIKETESSVIKKSQDKYRCDNEIQCESPVSVKDKNEPQSQSPMQTLSKICPVNEKCVIHDSPKVEGNTTVKDPIHRNIATTGVGPAQLRFTAQVSKPIYGNVIERPDLNSRVSDQAEDCQEGNLKTNREVGLGKDNKKPKRWSSEEIEPRNRRVERSSNVNGCCRDLYGERDEKSTVSNNVNMKQLQFARANQKSKRISKSVDFDEHCRVYKYSCDKFGTDQMTQEETITATEIAECDRSSKGEGNPACGMEREDTKNTREGGGLIRAMKENVVRPVSNVTSTNNMKTPIEIRTLCRQNENKTLPKQEQIEGVSREEESRRSLASTRQGVQAAQSDGWPGDSVDNASIRKNDNSVNGAECNQTPERDSNKSVTKMFTSIWRQQKSGLAGAVATNFVCMAFIIMWAPKTTIDLLKSFGYCSDCKTAYTVSVVIAWANSGVNALIYAWRTTDIRKTIVRMFTNRQQMGGNNNTTYSNSQTIF
eukprot:gene9646-10633_t